ncbi:MAG TPA: hypothetical protein VI408_15670 [Gaiellaceae bacterium]
MHDVVLRNMMANDRFEELRRAAFRAPNGTVASARVDETDVELRLCKPVDDLALENLAALAETTVPHGRLVVALVNGRIVAALPLAGGCAIRDPFARTSHIVRLLELRRAQLRPRAPRAGALRLLRRHA